MHLGEDVDLEVGVYKGGSGLDLRCRGDGRTGVLTDAVSGLVVYAYSETGVADELERAVLVAMLKA